MTIICFFAGCKWGAPVDMQLGPETVEWHKCKRCGSHRVLSKAGAK